MASLAANMNRPPLPALVAAILIQPFFRPESRQIQATAGGFVTMGAGRSSIERCPRAIGSRPVVRPDAAK
jgi:hypothetical protein